MKEKIVDIIDNNFDRVYSLDRYINNLDKEKKIIAHNILRDIAKKGTEDQRFVALTVINFQKPDYLEDFSLELMKIDNFSEIEILLTPIVELCSTIEKVEQLNFMLKVLGFVTKSKHKTQEHNSRYGTVLRLILITKYWESIINDINEFIVSSDERRIVDMLAYFIYNHGNKKYKTLLKKINNSELDKIEFLQDKVLKRLEAYNFV
jgi:hypothetical protein